MLYLIAVPLVAVSLFFQVHTANASQDVVAEASQRLHSSSSLEEVRFAVINAFNVANTLAASDPPASSLLLLSAAHTLYRHDNRDESLAVFEQLAQSAGSDRARIDANRMCGQIHMAAGNMAAAESYYAMALDLMHGTPDGVGSPALYGICALELASCLQSRGAHAEAIELRARASENPRVALDSSQRRSVLLQNARDLAIIGRITEAVALYNDLLDHYPDYGVTNGIKIGIMLEQARVNAASKDRSEWPNILHETWQRARQEMLPHSFQIGMMLANIHLRHPDVDLARASDILSECMQDIETLWPTLPHEAQLSGRSSRTSCHALHAVLLERTGHRDASLAAWQDLLARDPDPLRIEWINREIARLIGSE